MPPETERAPSSPHKRREDELNSQRAPNRTLTGPSPDPLPRPLSLYGEGDAIRIIGEGNAIRIIGEGNAIRVIREGDDILVISWIYFNKR